MRRFVIAQRNRNFSEPFLEKTLSLSNDYCLEYDENLSVTILNDNVIIIGLAVMDENSINRLCKQNPNDENILENIYSCVRDWSGRWILIFHKLIIGDPLNTLNVFYSTSDNKHLLSNSLGIFKELGYNWNREVFNPKARDEINWNISPKTRLDNVWLLLPFQIFDLSAGVTVFQRFIRLENNSLIGPNEINTSAIKILKQFSKFNKRIFLTLTAGYDSRYLFSVLLKTRENFSNILFVDNRIKKADVKISRILSKLFGITQRRIHGNSFSVMASWFTKSYRRKWANAFDCNNCQEIDRLWYIQGMYESTTESLLFRGNIGTEVFQGHKNYLYYPKGDGTFESVIAALRKKYPNLKEEQSKDLKYWWDYRAEFILNSNIDWRLLFWLDQRCCAWAGSINSIFDLTNYHAINPLNCDSILEQLYTYTNKGDIHNGYQKDLINELLPKLNDIPYNPKFKKFNVLNCFR